jgi:4-amino-4-deoxy-L-arabinose transferase-like glycosyltransferase
MSSSRRTHFLMLGVVFIAIHLLLFYVYGVRSLYDSRLYINSADFLVANGSIDESYRLFYAIPISALAFCRWIFPDQVIPFLILQILLSAAAAVSLYQAAGKIFNSNLAGFFSVMILLLWWDIIQWNTTVMTESIFLTLMCLLLRMLVTFSGKRNDWIWITLLLIAVLLTRPTGVVAVVSTLLFFIRYYWHTVLSRWWLRTSLIICLTLTAAFGAYLMFSLWDFTEQLYKGNLITYADVAEGSPWYDENLQLKTERLYSVDQEKHPLIKLLSFISDNPSYFIKTAAMKIAYLMTAIRPYYSWQHNVASGVWLLIIYIMFFFGHRESRNAPVKYSVLAMIIINCLLVGISTVDWDNRFYIPMVPGIVLMAGGGGSVFFARILNRQSKS